MARRGVPYPAGCSALPRSCPNRTIDAWTGIDSVGPAMNAFFASFNSEFGYWFTQAGWRVEA